MQGHAARLLPLLLVLGSLGAATLAPLPFAAASHNEDHPDPLTAPTMEWEEQVAGDARGDVLLHHPGTVDLLYMTVGELYSWSLGDSFLFIRIGYNISDDPEDTTVQIPEETGPLVPDIPSQVNTEPLVTVNVSANVSDERTIRFSLFTNDFGRSWTSDQGRLIADNGEVNGNREVLYIASLRRFGLEEGDRLNAWNVESIRDQRRVDTMQGFDPVNDYLPRYVPVQPLLEDPTAPVEDLPTPVPLPGPPPAPVPLPVPVPEPAEEVPNDPYPETPTLPVGVPYGVPLPDEAQDPAWLQDVRGGDGPPIDPERVAEDPTSGNAWNVTHHVTSGNLRFIVRAEREFVAASNQEVGFVNFTIDSRFEETDQNVMMFVVGPRDSRWLMRYGLDMPGGMKTLVGGGRVNMSAIVAPTLFATPQVTFTFVFLSNWGGFDFAQVTLISTTAAQVPPSANQGLPDLPDSLLVDLVNPDDPFRVNEPRKVMVQVLRGDNGKFQPDMKAVRAYIYPAGEKVPAQPYQLNQKAFSLGVYEIDFVFRKPGAWIVDVFFFDYPANENGVFPNIRFILSVDYPGRSEPLMPFPIALGSVGLLVAAIMVRERLTKNR